MSDMEKNVNEGRSGRPNREKTKRMLTIYGLVFVGVVVLLLIISWGAQLSENQRLEDVLEEQTIAASGVAEKYDNLRKENDKLLADNKYLKQQTDRMSTILAGVQTDISNKSDEEAAELIRSAVRRSLALDALSELQRTYRRSTSAVCRVLIADMEQECYSEWFDKEELEEYEYIKQKVRYVSK